MQLVLYIRYFIFIVPLVLAIFSVYSQKSEPQFANGYYDERGKFIFTINQLWVIPKLKQSSFILTLLYILYYYIFYSEVATLVMGITANRMYSAIALLLVIIVVDELVDDINEWRSFRRVAKTFKIYTVYLLSFSFIPLIATFCYFLADYLSIIKK